MLRSEGEAVVAMPVSPPDEILSRVLGTPRNPEKSVAKFKPWIPISSRRRLAKIAAERIVRIEGRTVGIASI